VEHFVTLFDSLFLAQGLALHASMQRHIKQYALWVLCVDDEVHRVLQMLALPNVRLLQLSQLETSNLLGVKAERTKGEYCWTLTPFAPRFVFEADFSVDCVTYIDADLWFRKDPIKIFQELDNAGKSVLITDHGYAPENDQSSTSGQYCVQFMVFKRHGGEAVRQWWEDRCIEWCYARAEDGKFGDQKYLETWPDIFADQVHVLQNSEWTLAPWNVTRFPYGNSVFFHFHGLRIVDEKNINLGAYRIPNVVLQYIYGPYLDDIKTAIKYLGECGVPIKSQAKSTSWFKVILSRLLHLLSDIFRKPKVRLSDEV
jgi:hypothetical protein